MPAWIPLYMAPDMQETTNGLEVNMQRLSSVYEGSAHPLTPGPD